MVREHVILFKILHPLIFYNLQQLVGLQSQFIIRSSQGFKLD